MLSPSTAVRRSFNGLLRALGGLNPGACALVACSAIRASQRALTTHWLYCIAHRAWLGRLAIPIFARTGGNLTIRYTLLAPALAPTEGPYGAADGLP